MPKRNLLWLLLLAITAATAVWVTRVGFDRNGSNGKDFSAVSHAYEIILAKANNPPDEKHLTQAGIRGMIESLGDQYCIFIPPDKSKRLRSRLGGQNFGLGIHLKIIRKQVIVLGTEMNSPAHRAGIVEGSQLLAVNDTTLVNLTLPEIYAILTDSLDESVSLTITDGKESRIAKLTAQKYPLESVTGLCRDDNGRWIYRIGAEKQFVYIRIHEFVPSTVSDLRSALQANSSAGGLVLDLRGNPGGMLESAIAVADVFLAAGLIAEVRARGIERNMYFASSASANTELPTIVLIDGKTASGGELVAGSLAWHGRAVLVGARTYGKASVQTLFTLGENLGMMNLTTARFLLASDKGIAGVSGSDTWGIDPHLIGDSIETPLPLDAREKLADLNFRGSLIPKIAEYLETAADLSPRQKLAREILALDTQLMRGIELLTRDDLTEPILDHARKQAEDFRLKKELDD